MTSIERLAIVIPARDETELIDNCLRSIAVAARRLPRGVSVSVVVVADGCTDDSAALARARGAHVLETRGAGGGVGVARAAGVAHALAAFDADPARLWIASTDADSSVSRGWLVDQLRAAESGADVRVGAVAPVLADLDATQIRAWRKGHRRGQARGHVHGANLGIRANRYLEVGGFRPLSEHEDVDIVDRLIAVGARVISGSRPDVVTSGRRYGRTPGGYAGYLRRLSVSS